ncbi:pleiotropic drug resistance ABC transporter [Amylocystis lapponica]|nr:pleiotropic drug resistance ABC transporter [Amylocystis lapponica]
MDPEQLSYGEDSDTVPALPLGPSVLAAHGNAAFHNAHTHNPSPYPSQGPGPSPGSTSHVDIGHFNPSGVDELRRTMSRVSADQGQSVHTKEKEAAGERQSYTSEATLRPGEGPFDFERALRQVIKKVDEADIIKRELGVVFKDLRVVGLGSSANYQATLASMLSPLTVLQKINSLRHPATRDILSGFEGVVRPGEMLLVLGRPGAGCSSLLRVLANQRSDFHAVEGDVHYDSFTPEEIFSHYRGDVQYSPEDDVHFPTLTVKQTLDFAATTRTPRTRIADFSRQDHVDSTSDVLMTIFGLRHAKDTLVGDASIRGVSGGEKKRVSISEMMATRSLLNSWDNSTRGLDASTALEFVQALRLATDICRMSTIVSIYQAGENLYQLFNKVCVIYEGKMAYFGRADHARQYFIDMGFEPANRQTTADFLVAVTDPLGRIVRSGFEARVPRTAIEFADTFKQSPLAQENRNDIDSYTAEFTGTPKRAEDYRTGAHAEHAKRTRKTSPYITSIPMQARALMRRRVQIIQGSAAAQIIGTTTFVLQAVIVGTIFLRLADSTATYFSRGGVLFFALLFSALSTMAEIPALFSQRAIVLRHSKAAMYHPFVEALAMTLVDAPMTLITIVVFSIVLYFVVGLQASAGQFFTFLLFVYTMTITMKGFFRMVAAAFNDPAPAQTIAGIAVLILVLYTGYSLPQPYMIGALRWITYINPLKYGFEALMVNEFHTVDGQCESLVPSGAGYETVSIANQVCTTVGSVSGQTVVSGSRYVQLSYEYTYNHLWRNFGILVAFGIGFISLLLIFTELNSGGSGETAVVLFKRGSHAPIVEEGGADEEKAAAHDQPASSSSSARETMPATPNGGNTFSFQDLSYIVPVSGGTRQLLDGVSGYVAPGKLTALMGESGAGKTTLLNVLSERTIGGVVTGDRFMNGQHLPTDFKSQTGYVQQMDTHLPTTTVREALLFSAKMRQPQSVPIEEKEAYVDMCLKLCGLEAHGDAVVGSLGVEHRKRTTIGVELVAKPSLIFLDEPTSGLDSQSAWAIMTFLRDLADSGQSIVCTIHQPSAELFEVFDRLLLLRKGGQTVYFGDLGDKSTQLIDYFESYGGRRCSDTENPAEYILDVIGAGATATTVIDWHTMWKQSKERKVLQGEIDAVHAEGHQHPPVTANMQHEFATSWSYQFAALCQRNLQSYWRDPVYLMAKLALNIVAGLLIGFTFFKAKNSIQGTQNKLFAVFMSLIQCVALANQSQVPFINTRKIYEIRERHSNMYSWTALVTSQIVVEIPWNMLGSSLYFLCWYWTVGFPSDRAGFTYLFFGVLFPLYYSTIGQAVAAMSPSAEIAALVFSFLFSFVLSFNGILQPFAQLGWWQWMYRLTPFTYLLEALIGQAVGHSDITCAAVELAQVTPPSGQTCSQYLDPFISRAGGYVTNPDATSECMYCAFSTTDAFLGSSFNILYSHRWRDVGIFCAFIVFNVFAIYFFTYMFRIRSGNMLGSLFAWVKKRVARRS